MLPHHSRLVLIFNSLVGFRHKIVLDYSWKENIHQTFVGSRQRVPHKNTQCASGQCRMRYQMHRYRYHWVTLGQ